jgi:hypothetical protein
VYIIYMTYEVFDAPVIVFDIENKINGFPGVIFPSVVCLVFTTK